MNTGAQLLDELAAFLRRYVVVTDAQAVAIVLWCAHTHAVDAAEATPFLAITSPAKRCGKTRLLDVLELLVAKPWRTVMPSEAVLFRKIAKVAPTLMLDETDAIFNSRNGNTEPLRALLNAGNRRGTSVPRCVGPTQTLVDFAIFCPKALAGIGALPDTVVDRSISIRMSRKRRDESAARFRIREATPRAKEIHDRLQAWSDASISRLESARPQIPSVLDDRAEEAWEPLLAIADLAGGDWPERARAAAAQLAGTDETDDEALAILLLRDVSAVFREHDVDRLSSADLASGLCEIEESPWGEMYGKALDARGLARRVKPFAIRPRTVRFSDGTTAKGYHREQFEDAFARYHSDVPNAPAQPFDDFDRHTVTTRMETGISPDSEPTHAAAENHRKPASVNGCVGVTDESAFEPFGPKDEAPLEPDWNEIDALRLEALRAGNEHDALTGKPPLPRPLIGDDLYPLYLAEAGNKGLITEDEFSRLYALQVFVGDGPDPERPPLDESLLCSPYDLPEEELEADELEAELW